MKILILGADGYLGWPTSVDLALDKHELLLRLIIMQKDLL